MIFSQGSTGRFITVEPLIISYKSAGTWGWYLGPAVVVVVVVCQHKKKTNRRPWKGFCYLGLISASRAQHQGLLSGPCSSAYSPRRYVCDSSFLTHCLQCLAACIHMQTHTNRRWHHSFHKVLPTPKYWSRAKLTSLHKNAPVPADWNQYPIWKRLKLTRCLTHILDFHTSLGHQDFPLSKEVMKHQEKAEHSENKEGRNNVLSVLSLNWTPWPRYSARTRRALRFH